jgi:hypothetical protein
MQAKIATIGLCAAQNHGDDGAASAFLNPMTEMYVCFDGGTT